MPTRIKALVGKDIERVAGGQHHTIFLRRDGVVYGCGSCKLGQVRWLVWVYVICLHVLKHPQSCIARASVTTNPPLSTPMSPSSPSAARASTKTYTSVPLFSPPPRPPHTHTHSLSHRSLAAFTA